MSRNFPIKSLLLIFLNLWMANVCAGQINGFDVSNASISQKDIIHGGPPKDGIPSIDQPKFVSAENAHFVSDESRVLGIVFNGEAKAYPIKILNWHELVNDSLGGNDFLISYCPLCGTGMAFNRVVDKKRLEFGVSGLLYNSDVLFYDRQSDSLWSQISRRAISGPYLGRQLEQLPLHHTIWAQWQSDFPETLVLSDRQGFKRNYDRDPYRGYQKSRQLFFKVSNESPDKYHTKEQVLGIVINGKAKAYPFIELRNFGQQKFTDTFQNKTLTVVWDSSSSSAKILDARNNQMVTTTAYWFAWFTFYPETEVFSVEN